TNKLNSSFPTRRSSDLDNLDSLYVRRERMHRVVAVLMMAWMMTGVVAMAQAPAEAPVGAVAEVQRSYAAVKENILKSADKMPARSEEHTSELQSPCNIV